MLNKSDAYLKAERTKGLTSYDVSLECGDLGDIDAILFVQLEYDTDVHPDGYGAERHTYMIERYEIFALIPQYNTHETLTVDVKELVSKHVIDDLVADYVLNT